MMSIYVYSRVRNGHIVIGSFISTVMRFSICDTDKRRGCLKIDGPLN